MLFVLTALFGAGIALPGDDSGFVAVPVFADTEEEAASSDSAEGPEVTGQVSLILTGDMHSHVQPEQWQQNGETKLTGGFAAVKAVIDTVRKEWPDSFVLDGGDFSMGTPYQTIEQNKAPELMLMGMMGYDATTLGNHEFDYRPVGLASMLNNASTGGQETVSKRDGSGSVVTTQGWSMPAIVGTNIDWEATMADEVLAEDADGLKTAFNRYGVQDYIILQRGGIRIAVFGLMGYEAIEDAPESGVIWQDPVDYARQTVDEIKRNGEADMIVCLSHSGVYDPEGEGRDAEDIELAKAIPEIDVILSAHTHIAYDGPITVGTTTIVSVGCYTKYVGHLVLDQTADGYLVNTFELLPVDGSAGSDKTVQAAADAYKKDIDSAYFSKFGFTYDQELAANEKAFTPMGEFGMALGEESLGNLIADSYVYAVQVAEGDAYEPVDVAIAPYGVIRSSFDEGPITAAEAYNVLSLGIGPDGVPGYPLVSVYLTGKELKTLADVDISVSPNLLPARLYFSGLTYHYNTHRMLFNRTTDHMLTAADGTAVELDNKKLYRVVGDLYTCQMIGLVSSGSKGMLSVVPKDKEGHTIIDFEEHIIADGSEKGGELKAWYALASYIDSFEGDVVPAKYMTPQGRKVDDTSLSPIKFLRQPNRFTVALIVLILLPLAIAALIVMLVRRRRHSRRGYKRSMFGHADFRPNGGKPVFKGKKFNRKKLFK